MKNVEEIPHFFHFIFCAICPLTGSTYYDIIERADHECYGPKFVKNLTIGNLEFFSTFTR